jgi:hypothetical protein
MGQFDFPSAAALDRLKKDEAPVSPGTRLSASIARIGGTLVEAIGFKGASAAGDLYAQLTDVAPDKDSANLLYFAEWVVWDIRKLYEISDEIRKLVEERIRTESAGQVLANATLYVPRTNIETRLQRLAHIFANGLRCGELEPESTDDMMRAAVELKEADVALLSKIYESQISLLNQQLRVPGQSPDGWHGNIQSVWRDFVNHGGLNPQEHLSYRSSFSRLESLGLIQYLNSAGTYGVGRDIYALLAEGKRFCERVSKIEAK